MVATRGYAHARIAVLERPKRDATRRDAHRPLLGGYGRARDRGITAGPVASLPSPPSPPARATVFRWWDTSRLLARHTRSPTIASLSPSSSYTCALRVRRRTRARTSGCAPDRGQRSEREARGRGRGVAPWEPRKTFPAYHPSAAPLPPPPPREENTSTHGLRTRPNTRESVRSGTAAKEVWSRDGPRDRPVTSQRTILSLPPFFSFSVLPRYLSLRATHLPSRSIPPLFLPTILIRTTQLRVYTYRGSNCVVGFFASLSGPNARDYENRNRPEISVHECRLFYVSSSLLSLSLFIFLLSRSWKKRVRIERGE